MSKYLSVKYLLISKQTGTLSWAVQKVDFGGSIWGFPKEGGTPNYVKTMLNICWYQNRLALYVQPFKKLIFWGPILEGFPEELPQKISGEKIAFAAQQLTLHKN